MQTLAIVLLALLVAVVGKWLLVLLDGVRGLRRWPPLRPRDPSPPPPADAPRLTVLIPARNEEARIEGTLRSVLAQDYPRLRVRFIDDQSTDRTFEIARAVASGSDRLEVVAGAERPPGWVGKTWALHQITRDVDSEWLLFVDGDMLLHPQAVGRAVGGHEAVRDRIVEDVALAMGAR